MKAKATDYGGGDYPHVDVSKFNLLYRLHRRAMADGTRAQRVGFYRAPSMAESSVLLADLEPWMQNGIPSAKVAAVFVDRQ